MLVSGRDPRIPYDLDEGYAVTFSRMRRMFRSRGLQPEEAADLAQEAIARALLHIKRNGCDTSYDGVGPLLTRIGTNLLIDRARANRLRLVPIDTTDLEELGADPTDEIELHVDRAELHTAIRSLSSRHQHAVMMSLHGHSPAEIASQLGIERNAADALLHRARKRLAERLRGAGHVVRLTILTALVRARLGARRHAGLEYAAASPGAVNIAAATFAAVLAVTAPMTASAYRSAPDAPPARTASSTEATEVVPPMDHPRETVADGSSSGGKRLARVGADVDPQRRELAVQGSAENPATGEEESLTAEVWHENEEQDRGFAGPVLDEVSADACELTEAPC